MILDGKTLAKENEEKLKVEIEKLKEEEAKLKLRLDSIRRMRE